MTHSTSRTLQVLCDELLTPCCRNVLLLQHYVRPGMCRPSHKISKLPGRPALCCRRGLFLEHHVWPGLDSAHY